MQVREAFDQLSVLETDGSISMSLTGEIANNLIMLEQYPEFLIASGEADFVFVRKRHGDPVMIALMDHIAKSLSGKANITDFQYISWLPIEVVQDPSVTNLVFTLYFKLWRDMRQRGMECFPYEFSTLGATSALFTQYRGIRLLEFAGL